MVNRERIIAGQRGEGKAALAKELRNTMTPHEAMLWKFLRAGRLEGYHFRRQQRIDGFIADFYCHTAGLIIELDGRIHEDQKEYDALRDTILRARNLLVLRFTNDQIEQNMKYVLAVIRKNTKERAIQIEQEEIDFKEDEQSPIPPRLGARGVNPSL
jgi:very-short-patch-repair endonuclease